MSIAEHNSKSGESRRWRSRAAADRGRVFATSFDSLLLASTLSRSLLPTVAQSLSLPATGCYLKGIFLSTIEPIIPLMYVVSYQLRGCHMQKFYRLCRPHPVASCVQTLGSSYQSYESVGPQMPDDPSAKVHIQQLKPRRHASAS